MSNRTYNKEILVRQQNLKGVFFKKILEMINKDSRICFLTSDALMENGILRNAMEEYKDRIIDVGIAEQNLIGVAAGYALSGMIPYVCAMAPFLPLRALEHIHTDIAYNDVPVKIISVSAGTVSRGGPTHNLISDFGILGTIPNITILSPSDMKQFLLMIEMLVDYPKPVYLRMPQANWKEINTNQNNIKIGVAVEKRSGGDAYIVATGRCVYSAMVASDKLKNEGISVGVVDMHTIKPLDREIIKKVAKTKCVVVVEDHNVQGGLGSMVEAVIAQEGISCKVEKLGIQDEFAVLGSGEEIASFYNFDSNAIINVVKDILKT